MSNNMISMKQGSKNISGRFYVSKEIFTKDYGLTNYAKLVYIYLSRCADKIISHHQCCAHPSLFISVFLFHSFCNIFNINNRFTK